jgi:ABC-type dipeptide/oligopeptide/nickel transport system permease component
MNEAIAPSLEAWATFYVIVGSSAGALTGLQFVVMTLISENGPTRARGETISAFGTPNVVHFCASLLVACILSIPWRALHPAGTATAVCGALGVLYGGIVMRRALRQREYRPVFEDWLWHTILPALAYAILFAGGLALAGGSAGALFWIGPAALLLVLVGIHNAWDTVTFVTTRPDRT